MLPIQTLTKTTAVSILRMCIGFLFYSNPMSVRKCRNFGLVQFKERKTTILRDHWPAAIDRYSKRQAKVLYAYDMPV